MELVLPTGYAFLLVLLRTAGLVVAMPLWGAKSIPSQVKIGIAFALAAAIFSGAGYPKVSIPANLMELAGTSLVETAIGIFAGHAARVMLETAASAGNIAASSMGLTYGSTLDPINGSGSNAVAEFLNILATCTAIAAGLHREAVVWLGRSIIEHPPGSIFSIRDAALAAVHHAGGAMLLGLRLGYPFVIVVTFAHIVLAIMGRTAPQLSINSVGFTFSLVAGWGALYVAAPVVAQWAVRAAMAAFTGG